MIPNLFKWFIESMKAIYNSRILPEEEITLQIRNRAFCYGDGLFETIVTGPDRINLLAYHVIRLRQGCEVLGMELPFTEQQLEEYVESLKMTNGLAGTVRIRAQVWRDTGGLYEPTEDKSSFVITVAETSYPFFGTIERLSVSEKARLNFHALSFAKTMSAMPYVLAGVERKQSSYDELIITDMNGNIAECVASNIFWVKKNTVYTPDLKTGCIRGTLRDFLIQSFKSADIIVNEVMEPVESVTEADHVFLSNASGIRWVKHFEDKARFSNPEGLLKSILTLPQQP